jgi:hypothetical protein
VALVFINTLLTGYCTFAGLQPQFITHFI